MTVLFVSILLQKGNVVNLKMLLKCTSYTDVTKVHILF